MWITWTSLFLVASRFGSKSEGKVSEYFNDEVENKGVKYESITQDDTDRVHVHHEEEKIASQTEEDLLEFEDEVRHLNSALHI